MTTRSPWEKWLDRGFQQLAWGGAIALLVLLIGFAVTLGVQAWPAIHTYGWGFLVAQSWNPVLGRETYGVLPMLYGTLVSAAIALLLALPIGVGTAIFLSERILPPPLNGGLVFLVELLAAIPSVVYGLWGIFVLIPALQPGTTWLHQTWGWFPLFKTAPLGPGLLPAGMILAVMILPIITAISRQVLIALPLDLRMGTMALGATRWETLGGVLLPAAGNGVLAASLLALGRALGETMAVTMVVGNSNRLSVSLLAPANTIASLLANQFPEAQGMQVASLMYAGGVLLITTVLVNGAADWIVMRFGLGWRSYP